MINKYLARQNLIDAVKMVIRAIKGRDHNEPGWAEKEKAELEMAAIMRRIFRKQQKRIREYISTLDQAPVPNKAMDNLLLIDLKGALLGKAAKYDQSIPYNQLLAVDPDDYAQWLAALEDATFRGILLLGQHGAPGLDYGAINEHASVWAQLHTDEIFNQLNNTSQDILGKAIAEYIETPGMTLGDTMDKLWGIDGRADVIAVTETTRAYAQGNQLIGQEMASAYPDAPVFKIWFTNNDDLVCDICGELDGMEVPIDDQFVSTGFFTDNPPAHTNCRCWTDVRTQSIPPEAEPKPEPTPAPVTEPTPAPQPAFIPPEPLAATEPIAGTGRPVSEAYTNNCKGKKGKAVTHTLDAIDSVHGDGKLPNLPIESSQSSRYMGSFNVTRFDNMPVKIEISTTDHPHMTFAHESGHFLDHDGLGIARQFTSESADPIMANWWGKVHNSDPVLHLESMLKNPSAYAVTKPYGVGGLAEITVTPDRAHIRYLLTDREIFARSYAQYIAEASGDEIMLGELKEMVASEYNAIYTPQWNKDEFVPIKDAFDDLFTKMGWKK